MITDSLSRRRRAAAALGVIVLVAACQHDFQQSTGLKPSASLQTQQADPEREALDRLARAVAIALGDTEFRGDVKGKMQKAPFKEHKLELRKFLTSSVAKSIADVAGTTSKAILADLDLVRPLELYMPVESQRASWTGGSDLIVVAGIEEDDPITGFDLRGNRVPVSSSEPPAVPTIVLVPVETRFDQPLDARKSINIDDQAGRAIGTLGPRGSRKPVSLIACGDECGGGGGGGTYGVPGYYMTFSRIVDAKEPWWKGSPEVEVHVHGPLDASNNQYGADLSCSGERALNERYFDQDGGFWNGSVLVVAESLNDLVVPALSDGYHIIFWEDDSTPCQIKINVEVVNNLIASTLAAAGTAALKGTKFGWGLVAGAFLASMWQNKDWLLGNDDMIGTLVPSTSGWADGSNYTIMLGSSINGRVKIVQK